MYVFNGFGSTGSFRRHRPAQTLRREKQREIAELLRKLIELEAAYVFKDVLIEGTAYFRVRTRPAK